MSGSRRLRHSRLLAVMALVVAIVGVGWRAPASPAAGLQKLSGYGADSCTAPSLSQMKAFWTNTPYSYWGIYIGGGDRGCAQPNLTSSWVNSVIAMGWDLEPIWVGRQNPCTGGQAIYFSLTPSTALAQGKSEALAAYNAWIKLQNTPSVPITLDLCRQPGRLRDAQSSTGLRHRRAMGRQPVDARVQLRLEHLVGQRPAPQAVPGRAQPDRERRDAEHRQRLLVRPDLRRCHPCREHIAMPLGGRAMVRHPIWLGLVAMTFAVAGCASADHAAPPAQGAAASVTSPVITGSRDGHTVAYAPAATQWTTVALPHRAADGQSVAAHGHDIYAAVRAADGVTLEVSHDGGQSWQRRPVAGTSDPGTVDLALSADGTRLAIVLDHPGAAGAVGQAAVLLGEAKGGAFTSHDAPAGGRVTWWNGRLALSGGALSSRLYVSDPKASAWTPVAVGGPVAPLRNVDPGVASIGAPIDQPDGSLLVPVTNHAGSPSVDLFATTDGATFRKVAAIALSGELGAGTAAPVAVLPDGTVLVADPNAMRMHVVRGSAQSSFFPRGLPAPPSTMTFASATMGIARVDIANCASGKTGCTVRTEVYTTADGGKSWERS